MDSSKKSTDTLKWGDKHFVKKAAEGGQNEIALAELAAQRTSNPEIRSFAQQIQSDHQAMCRQLEQLAQTKGIQSDIAEYHVKTSSSPDAVAANATSSNSNTMSSTSPNSQASATPSTDRARAGTLSGSTGEYDAGSAMKDHSSTKKTSDMSDWNDPTQDRHYRHLAAKSGADFDKEFISMMVSDHEDTVAMFQKEAKKADDSEVRAFAQDNLPKLQEHLSRAQQIAASLKS